MNRSNKLIKTEGKSLPKKTSRGSFACKYKCKSDVQYVKDYLKVLNNGTGVKTN